VNKNYYRPIPCGATIPLNNPHAFSVSMPTIQDVIDYEEQNPASQEKIKSAYPRIVVHPYIKIILKCAAEELHLEEGELFLLPHLACARLAAEFSGTEPEYFRFYTYTIAFFSKEKLCDASEFFAIMKHCGFMIYSREAEDFLCTMGHKPEFFKENEKKEGAEENILTVLSDGYGTPDIVLSSSGMNAIYTGFSLVQESAHRQGKNLMILLGWAYSDTIEIIKKCSKEFVLIPDVHDLVSLKKLLSERGHEVSALYVETVSNPLIAVADIPQLHAFSREYDFPLLVDNTFATPWCVDISPYCDLIFESLTKFASGAGDLMAGAVILPKGSRLDPSIKDRMADCALPLYKRDLYRLSENISGYKDRMATVSENSKRIEETLRHHSEIGKIYSVHSQDNRANWNKIVRGDSSCGVLSFLFKGDLAGYYDNISLPKGPSLGTAFPILMPYTLLAHYHQTKNKEGLESLVKAGLHPDLLRLSIGSDNPDLTLRAFDAVFTTERLG
jgi:cystathionine gamma-synthase